MFSWNTRSFLDKHWSDIDTTSILYKLNLTWYKWFESNWYFICHLLFDWLNFLLPFVLVSTKQCGTSHKYTSIYSFSFYFFPCLVGFSHFIITTFAWEKFTVKESHNFTFHIFRQLAIVLWLSPDVIWHCDNLTTFLNNSTFTSVKISILHWLRSWTRFRKC